jgi:hypothetical protein
MADINPYAAPRVPDPLLPDRPPPGGAWRDGRMLVVHRRGGALPHICLLTGQPADVRRREQVEWWYMIDFARRLTTVEFGLSKPADQSNRRWRRCGSVVMIAAPCLFVTVMVAIVLGLLPGRYLLLWIVGSLMTLAAGGLVYSRHSPLLRFERVRGDFLWIRGAHSTLLACLPEWPGPR